MSAQFDTVPRIVPDSECKQGKCAMTTTGCIGHCRLHEIHGVPQTTVRLPAASPDLATLTRWLKLLDKGHDLAVADEIRAIVRAAAA